MIRWLRSFLENFRKPDAYMIVKVSDNNDGTAATDCTIGGKMTLLATGLASALEHQRGRGDTTLRRVLMTAIEHDTMNSPELQDILKSKIIEQSITSDTLIN